MAFSVRARNEILDGAKRLPASLCNFEADCSRPWRSVAIFVSYGSLKGVEPGVSLLVVLVVSQDSGSAHGARVSSDGADGMGALSLRLFSFAGLCDRALSLLTAFALLLVALIQFHRGSSPGAFWPPLATTCKILLQAAPLVVLLFLLFPRINTGLRF